MKMFGTNLANVPNIGNEYYSLSQCCASVAVTVTAAATAVFQQLCFAVGAARRQHGGIGSVQEEDPAAMAACIAELATLLNGPFTALNALSGAAAHVGDVLCCIDYETPKILTWGMPHG